MFFLYISIYFIGLLFSFYFSGSEAGFLSIKKDRFNNDHEKGVKGTKTVKYFIDNPDKLLSLTLFGNNLANITTANIGLAFIMLYVTNIQDPNFSFYRDAVNIITIFVLFTFGEVIPKLLFRTYAYRLVYFSGAGLNVIYTLLYPFLFFIDKISDIILLPLKVKTEIIRTLSYEDVSHIIHDSYEEGLVDEDESYFLNTVSSLSKIKVIEVMKPLADLYMINKYQDISLILDILKKEKYEMVPVYDGRIDNIIGYIDIIDVFNSTRRKKIAKDYIKETDYIPETNTVDKIYQHFTSHNPKLLVIVDEYGGCSGVVLEHDIITRIFGFQYGLDEKQTNEMIKNISPCEFEVDTHYDIDDLNEKFKIKIPKNGYETLGGFINFLFGRIPQTGEDIQWEGIHITITKSNRQGVDKVLFKVPKDISPNGKKKKKTS